MTIARKSKLPQVWGNIDSSKSCIRKVAIAHRCIYLGPSIKFYIVNKIYASIKRQFFIILVNRYILQSNLL